MKPVYFLLAGLLVLISCMPVLVQAQSANLTSDIFSVSSYSFTATPGYVIDEIIVDALPMGTNQTHYLAYNGATFTLSIGTNESWGIYNTFVVSLTYPNGTVQTQTVTSTQISAGQYQTIIQPVFTKQASGYMPYFTINLEIGVMPVSVGLGTQPASYNVQSAIPFSSASGTLGGITNVHIYQLSQTSFVNNVQNNYNPVYGFSSVTSSAASWAVSQVTGLIGAIPVIGPIVLTMMDIVGTVAGELLYWLIFVISYLPYLIVGMEGLIGVISVIMAGKDKTGLKTAKNFYKYNKACVMGMIWLVNLLWTWGQQAVIMIAWAIQAIRSLLPI